MGVLHLPMAALWRGVCGRYHQSLWGLSSREGHSASPRGSIVVVGDMVDIVACGGPCLKEKGIQLLPMAALWLGDMVDIVACGGSCLQEKSIQLLPMAALRDVVNTTIYRHLGRCR